MEDMAGGTFTISNGGVFGSLMGTPIINLPQVRRLGVPCGVCRRRGLMLCTAVAT
jgi:pyruvate/2-oxoglutarate dehydrogenase complex dihydrolipoamide acyltransferase (E2) component